MTMIDRGFGDEPASYPPHVIPNHPGTWTVVAGTPTAGQIALGPPMQIHKIDASGGAHGQDYASLAAGDTVTLIHGTGQSWAGTVDTATDADPLESITFTGSTGTAPNVGDVVSVQVTKAPTSPHTGGTNPPPDPDPDPAPPVPEPPTEIDASFDPAEWTVEEVKRYIDAIADAAAVHDEDPAVVAETQRVHDLELVGLNRSTLVDWLDHRYGVIGP